MPKLTKLFYIKLNRLSFAQSCMDDCIDIQIAQQWKKMLCSSQVCTHIRSFCMRYCFYTRRRVIMKFESLFIPSFYYVFSLLMYFFLFVLKKKKTICKHYMEGVYSRVFLRFCSLMFCLNSNLI